MKHNKLRVAVVLVIAALSFCGLFCSTAFANTPMIVGEVFDASAYADSASADTPTYTSSDKKILKVSKKGQVTAKAAGGAIITVSQGDSTKEVNCKVFDKGTSKQTKAAGVSVANVATLVATQSGTNAAKLSWSASKDAKGYAIYMKTSSGYKIVALTKKTNFTVSNLTVQNIYKFQVCAYKSFTVVNKVTKTSTVKKGKTTQEVKTVQKVKTTLLALGTKSYKVSMLVTDDTSTRANASSITFDRTKISIVRKGTGTVTAHVNSSVEGLPVTTGGIRYISSDTSVATVSTDGVVTSKTKADASCTITAVAHDGVNAQIKVQVLSKLDKTSALWIAHRGDMSVAPENTLAAYTSAAQRGFDGIEFDVWETNDGGLVIMHDANMQRMCGVDMSITNVNTIDFNSPNYYDNYNIISGNGIESYGVQKVLTFEQVVAVAAAYNLKASVHIKNRGSDPITQEGLDKIISILDRYNMQGKAILVVQDKDSLQLISSQKSYRAQFVLTTEYCGYDVEGENYKEEIRAAADYAASVGCARLSIAYRADALIDAATVSYCHSLGLEVGTWNASSKVKACYLLDIGVDSLTADKKLFE